MKKRFKSYKFWVALSGAVVIFAKSLGEAFGFNLSEQVIDSVIMGFCGVLVVLGIVEKPQTPNQETSEVDPASKSDEKNNLNTEN